MKFNNVFTEELYNNHLLYLRNDSKGCKLVLSGVDLSCANLSRATLNNADLSDADLSDVYLSRANLSHANLSGANLSHASLTGADLSCANLSYANLSRATLNNADLSDADLSNADLSFANLSCADLSGVNLSCADLSGVNLRFVKCGDDKRIFTRDTSVFHVVFAKYEKVLAIGCKQYTIDEWKNATNDEISKMDKNALSFWTEWKSLIFNWIDNVNH